MKKIGSIIVLSGPSGVGKSTLVAALRQAMPELRFSVSCTTRAPRGSEVHGKEYYFLSEEEFSRRIEAGEFVEHAGVFAHRYGTLKSEVLNFVRNGETVLLDIDVQGAMQIRSAMAKDAFLARATDFIFLAPPSVRELEKRLRGRGTDSEEQIRIRLSKSLQELSFWDQYDYIVVNDGVERAAAELLSVVRALGCAARKWEGAPFEA